MVADLYDQYSSSILMVKVGFIITDCMPCLTINLSTAACAFPLLANNVTFSAGAKVQTEQLPPPDTVSPWIYNYHLKGVLLQGLE
ncbi:hypothetical protein XENTR_v10016320 [Xenopus tropicalis]|nr:hypothetical protein XENTR_v10016320 [Xenopus tropicalis]